MTTGRNVVYMLTTCRNAVYITVVNVLLSGVLTIGRNVVYITVVYVPLSGVVATGGCLYVVGGDDGSSNLGSVEMFDPKTNTWTLLNCSMMTKRSYAGVSVIERPNV